MNIAKDLTWKVADLEREFPKFLRDIEDYLEDLGAAQQPLGLFLVRQDDRAAVEGQHPCAVVAADGGAAGEAAEALGRLLGGEYFDEVRAQRFVLAVQGLLHIKLREHERAREPLRRALFWQGFGAIGPNCFVHPSADLGEVPHALAADGLADSQPHLMPLLASDARYGLSANDADLVRRAWNLDALAQAYTDFEALYQDIAEALHPAVDAPAALGDEEVFLLRTLLIHDWRRLLLRDPGLPDVLLPPDWPGQRCLLYTSPSPRDRTRSRMPSSA